jgi:hypothetical protein
VLSRVRTRLAETGASLDAAAPRLARAWLGWLGWPVLYAICARPRGSTRSATATRRS